MKVQLLFGGVDTQDHMGQVLMDLVVLPIIIMQTIVLLDKAGLSTLNIRSEK